MAEKPDDLDRWWEAVNPGRPQPPNIPHPGCPCGFRSGLCCAYVQWAGLCSPGRINANGLDR